MDIIRHMKSFYKPLTHKPHFAGSRPVRLPDRPQGRWDYNEVIGILLLIPLFWYLYQASQSWYQSFVVCGALVGDIYEEFMKMSFMKMSFFYFLLF